MPSSGGGTKLIRTLRAVSGVALNDGVGLTGAVADGDKVADGESVSDGDSDGIDVGDVAGVGVGCA